MTNDQKKEAQIEEIPVEFADYLPLEWGGKTAKLTIHARAAEAMGISRGDRGLIVVGDKNGTIILIRDKKVYELVKPWYALGNKLYNAFYKEIKE